MSIHLSIIMTWLTSINEEGTLNSPWCFAHAYVLYSTARSLRLNHHRFPNTYTSCRVRPQPITLTLHSCRLITLTFHIASSLSQVTEPLLKKKSKFQEECGQEAVMFIIPKEDLQSEKAMFTMSEEDLRSKTGMFTTRGIPKR